MSAEVWGVDYEYTTRTTAFVQADTKQEAEEQVKQLWEKTKSHRSQTTCFPTNEVEFKIIHAEKELLP